MDVASRWPLPVGVVRWHAPDATLTVIVKATFRLDGPRPGVLSEKQLGLFRDDAAGGGTEEELERASDFAPRKARADVLLVGCAHAAEPCSELRAALEVDGLVKRFRAGAGVPSTAIPLLADYLARDDDGAVPVRVAPRPRSLSGPSSRAMVPGFDFGRFNVAPRDQQLDALSSRARLVLRGLLPGGETRHIQLPGLEPAVFLVRSRQRPDTSEPVPLVCDTLWIHTDEAVCTLCWRGAVLAPAVGSYLLLDASYGQAPDWARVVADLGGARWSQAMEGVEAGARSVRRALDDEEQTRTMPHRDIDDETTEQIEVGRPAAREEVEPESMDPESIASAPDTPRLGVVLGTHRGSALGGMVLGRGAVAPPLPFEPTSPRVRETTEAMDDAAELVRMAAGDSLPFRRAGSEPPTAPARASVLQSVQEVATRLRALGDVRTSTATEEYYAPSLLHMDGDSPLPFRKSEPAPQSAIPAAAPPPRVPPPVLSAEVDTVAALSLRVELPLVTEPPPSEPRARDDLVALELYATVKVALLRGQPLAAVLERHGLDEVSWRSEERRRAQALSSAAERGDLAVVRTLRRALREAQRRAEEEGGAGDRK